MRSETFRYPAVGTCIYCGTQSNLTDEHIIPLSLGGVLILPQASCAGKGSCNDKTHKFEGVVARQIFGKFRARHKLPTRRPKERPTEFEFSTAHGPKFAAASEYPTELFVYKFYKPNASQGMPKDFDTSTSHWVPVAVCDSNELNEFMKAHGWDGRLSIIPRPYEFARMLAKIAHAYAVAEFGLGSFTPYAIDLILGNDQNFSYCVGGDWEVPPGQPDGGHLLHFGFDFKADGVLITSYIRLFASCGTPQYEVVVGKAERPAQIGAILQKISKGGKVEIFRP
jgi:hypothetical protein